MGMKTTYTRYVKNENGTRIAGNGDANGIRANMETNKYGWKLESYTT